MFCRGMQHRVLISDGGRDEEGEAEAVRRGEPRHCSSQNRSMTCGAKWPGRRMLNALALQTGSRDPEVFYVSVEKTSLLCGRLLLHSLGSRKGLFCPVNCTCVATHLELHRSFLLSIVPFRETETPIGVGSV